MPRKYTAQEMRDYADAIAGDLEDNGHKGVEYCYSDLIPVIEALRQAADDLERERRYEYAVKYIDGRRVWESSHHYESIKLCKKDHWPLEGRKFIRRDVGEWEEVE